MRDGCTRNGRSKPKQKGERGKEDVVMSLRSERYRVLISGIQASALHTRKHTEENSLAGKSTSGIGPNRSCVLCAYVGVAYTS